MSAIRYFQFVNWEQWYPRKDYKSMPWVKVSTKFFEDPKLDDLSAKEKLAIIWLITESGRQNLGTGRVRVADISLTSHCQFRRKSEAVQCLNTLVRIGVLIELSEFSRTDDVLETVGIRAQEVRVRGKNKNPPTPLNVNRSDIVKSFVDTFGNKFPPGGAGS